MKRVMILCAALSMLVALGTREVLSSATQGDRGVLKTSLEDQIQALKARGEYRAELWSAFFANRESTARARGTLDQGGDSIGSAVVVPSLPFMGSGSTSGTVDNYFETCGKADSGGSGDVVYSYYAWQHEVVDISLCTAPNFDTKLYIYQNTCTPGNPYACNDDYCGLLSQLNGIMLFPGNTYYIVVDGYGGDAGNYTLEATICQPFGRCCYGDPQNPSCADNTAAECSALGGMWTVGLNCTANPCPPPMGRCCYNGGLNCVDNLQAECTALGGTWTFGMSCAPNPCPPPMGRCCYGFNNQCADNTQTACTALGGAWTADVTCASDPCAPPPVPPFLRVGDWMNPEPWHNWIGGANEVTRLQLHILDPTHQIYRVDFFYSLDGQQWTLLNTDYSGYEPWANTVDSSVVDSGDGWSGYFPHNLIPQQNIVLHFRAVAYWQSDSTIVENQRDYDATPPNSVTINIDDWDTFVRDRLYVDVMPVTANIDYVLIYVVVKTDTFMKGIPEIFQPDTQDCLPTAAAACLKWFEAQGDTQICDGLDDEDLVYSLGVFMGTHPTGGTSLSGAVNGLLGWIQNHGNGYTVEAKPYAGDAWKELERGQDVISVIAVSMGGFHAMTWNSIVNRPLPNGLIRVDFMNPWTGEIEWGDMDPATGQLTLTGLASRKERGRECNSGRMFVDIIVCPKGADTSGDGRREGPPPGPDPDPFPVPIPYPGLWFLHVVVIDLDAHAHRLIRVVERLLPAVRDLVIQVFGDDVVLDWSAAPFALYYEISTAPASDGLWTSLDTTTGTSYTHVGGAGNAKLFYRVTARN